MKTEEERARQARDEKRELFAVVTLHALLSEGPDSGWNTAHAKAIARRCYEIADAMLSRAAEGEP